MNICQCEDKCEKGVKEITISSTISIESTNSL